RISRPCSIVSARSIVISFAKPAILARADKAPFAQFSPERHRVLATLRQALLQVRHVWVEDARPRAICGPSRKSFRLGVLAHRCARQPHRTLDRLQRLAGITALAHLIVDRPPARPARRAGGPLGGGAP